VGPSNQAIQQTIKDRRTAVEGVSEVFVPTRPTRPSAMRDDPQQVEFETRETSEGLRALPVFTSHDLLVAQLGPYQASERLPVLELLIQISGVALPVVVNPQIDATAQRWTAEDLQTWRQGQA
jgi:hypothetical protein